MEARQRRRTERIGRLEQDTFRSGAKLASHRKKVLKGWFSFTPPPTLEPDQITFLFCFHRDTQLSATIYTIFSKIHRLSAPLRYGSWKMYHTSFQFPSTYFPSRMFFHFLLFSQACKVEDVFIFLSNFGKWGKSSFVAVVRLF